MSDDLDILGAASVGALVGKAPVSEVEQAEAENACPNCGAPLTGQFCQACGQVADDFHRPVWGLLKDTLSDAFSLDGRIARTLPALMLRPGKVTRAYLEGKRARYVPPFRLFLLSSLIFFFTLFAMGDRAGILDGFYVLPQQDGGFQVHLGAPDEGTEDIAAMTPEQLRAYLESDVTVNGPTGQDDTDEFIDAAVKVFENQRLIAMGIERWAPRLSFLLLPLMALTLTLQYAWWRRVYVYDHLITSLHFQSFGYLLGAGVMGASLVVGGHAAWVLLFIPIYLYRLLRETYRSGRFMSGLRAFGLIITLVVLMTLISIGVAVLGYMDV